MSTPIMERYGPFQVGIAASGKVGFGGGSTVGDVYYGLRNN